MSLSIVQPTIPFFALTFASLLTVMASPAGADSPAKHKHSVYVIDRDSEGSETSATPGTSESPAPESSKETRTAASARERLKVNAANPETLGFQDFYPITDPQTPVRSEAETVKDHKTLYWFGAAGAALAAGVAAWFIFSSEPERQSTAFIVP